jgi:hypothetical protein
MINKIGFTRQKIQMGGGFGFYYHVVCDETGHTLCRMTIKPPFELVEEVSREQICLVCQQMLELSGLLGDLLDH